MRIYKIVKINVNIHILQRFVYLADVIMGYSEMRYVNIVG